MELQLFLPAGSPPRSTAANLQKRKPKIAISWLRTHTARGSAGYEGANQALQENITCKEGGGRRWINRSGNNNSLFGGTQYGVTLMISVPPWQEWFAETVMNSDLERKYLTLIWGS